MTKLLRRSGFAVVIGSIFLTGVSAGQDDVIAPETEQQKLFYYMGALFGDSLVPMRLSNEEIELVMRGQCNKVSHLAYSETVHRHHA